MIEFIQNNWILLVLVGVLVIDKIVAMTKCKWDDLIWTAIKSSFKSVFPGMKGRGPVK